MNVFDTGTEFDGCGRNGRVIRLCSLFQALEAWVGACITQPEGRRKPTEAERTAYGVGTRG